MSHYIYRENEHSRSEHTRRDAGETSGSFSRPPWAPTPLNPYNLRKKSLGHGITDRFNSPDFVPYLTDALATVNEVYSQNVAKAGTYIPPYIKEQMVYLIMSSLHQRFAKNDGKTIAHDVEDETARLFEAACLGTALPADLVELLIRQPDLVSLEIAKISRPFDWNGTTELDAKMMELLANTPGATDEVDRVPRLYVHARDHRELHALQVVRKVRLGLIDTTAGQIDIMQRDSLILDLMDDELAPLKDELYLWLKDCIEKKTIKGAVKLMCDGRTILTQRYIEDRITDTSSQPMDGLYPAVRSCYAHIVT